MSTDYDFKVSKETVSQNGKAAYTCYRLHLTYARLEDLEFGLTLKQLKEIASFLTAYVEREEKEGGAR